jgi:hypothetical protein
LDESAGQHTALCDDLRILARRHPRSTWAGHASLGDLARFWLHRHEMFRHLDEIVRSGTEAALEQRMKAAAFNPWLSGQLSWLLWQLAEHRGSPLFPAVPAGGTAPCRWVRAARARPRRAARGHRRHNRARQRRASPTRLPVPTRSAPTSPASAMPGSISDAS